MILVRKKNGVKKQLALNIFIWKKYTAPGSWTRTIINALWDE
jgi:hypothetical protein